MQTLWSLSNSGLRRPNVTMQNVMRSPPGLTVAWSSEFGKQNLQFSLRIRKKVVCACVCVHAWKVGREGKLDVRGKMLQSHTRATAIKVNTSCLSDLLHTQCCRKTSEESSSLPPVSVPELLRATQTETMLRAILPLSGTWNWLFAIRTNKTKPFQTESYASEWLFSLPLHPIGEKKHIFLSHKISLKKIRIRSTTNL